MLSEEDFVKISRLKVTPGSEVSLKNYSTAYEGKTLQKSQAVKLLEVGRRHLAEVQEKLYAQNRYSVLILLQAMDAAGKDSAVKHIMSGFNPLGVKVYSFKAPTPQELDHHYLWRHNIALPARGEIAIHNRSHYENVLVTRVHPELLLKEQLPGLDSVNHIGKKFWNGRFKQINRFEKNISQNGTIILKFFLHLSKAEQKKRFLERIDDAEKHWKFSIGDLRERARWDDYHLAYEEAISATSTKHAPWYIIPADDKWYTRLAIAGVIYQQFKALKIDYPPVTDALRADLMEGRDKLMNE
ncbi:MAG TPA: polyphosphate kinase 2 family protein [Chryseolinea sp.]